MNSKVRGTFFSLNSNIPSAIGSFANAVCSIKQPSGFIKFNTWSVYIKKIKSLCENCGKKTSTEIHHLIPQKNADKNGMIRKEDGSIFHKNHLANLMAVCESCHQKIHHK
jgi:5-methylcytosine-specific restriction endonuclease McrA